jgi:hypothetical protein
MALPHDHISNLSTDIRVLFCHTMNTAVRAAAEKTAAIVATVESADQAAELAAVDRAPSTPVAVAVSASAARAAFKMKKYGPNSTWITNEAEREYWLSVMKDLNQPAILYAAVSATKNVMEALLQAWSSQSIGSTLPKLKTILTNLGYSEPASLLTEAAIIVPRHD